MALSDGWSSDGNHAIDPAGSPSASAPSSVRTSPSCGIVGIGQQLGHALIAHCRLEPRPAADHPRGPYGQLCALAARPGRHSLHRGPAHGEPGEVEVEAAQLLGGRRRDDRGAAQPPGPGVVGQVEAIVRDVVAAVARVKGRAGHRGRGRLRAGRTLRRPYSRERTRAGRRPAAVRGPRAAAGVGARGPAYEAGRWRPTRWEGISAFHSAGGTAILLRCPRPL